MNQTNVVVPETVINETICVAREFDEFTLEIEIQANNGKISVPSLNATELKKVRDKCGPKFIGEIHDGERECLTFLISDTSSNSILCSSDAVIFRYLGWIQQPDIGISLEEVAHNLGITRNKMPWKLTKTFREKYTQQGFKEALQSGILKL